MKIIKLLTEKSREPVGNKVPTIAFFGDSVTQGCFELYMKTEELLGNVCDEAHTYHSHVKAILNFLYPNAPVNIINSGLAGDNSVEALKRLGQDVLSYQPDLTVVCFGLNDSCFGIENLKQYQNALTTIFRELKKAGSEVIFMTPNMMNTDLSPRIEPPMAMGNAKNTMKIQQEGILEMFLEEAKKICAREDVVLCDCYKKWKMLSDNGVDTTELLANKINHPRREMHWLFAGMLVDTMLEN